MSARTSALLGARISLASLGWIIQYAWRSKLAFVPLKSRSVITRIAFVLGGPSLWLSGEAAELSGIVTEVSDGDTLTLVNWQATYKIRLADIDAPEWKQERGKDSRASLFHLRGLRRATAETQGEDRYGRTLARMTCAGVDANAEQVRRGWAWVYVRYAPKDSPLYGIERDARLGNRGLWADTDPVPPWE